MRYFSMYSGIGGNELAMPIEWKCVGYSEIDKKAIQVYEKHFSHKNYGNADTIQPKKLPDFEILVGGFPCQSFSIAGSRKGFDDTRGTQFFNIARIVKEKRPKYLLLENVKGLLSHDNGRTYKTILSTLTELGYDTEAMVFDSYFWNAAPRTRVFMLAYDREQGTPTWQRDEQAISLYSCFRERIRNQETPTREHETVRSSERIIRTFAKLPHWLDSWNTIYAEKVEAG